MNTIKDLMLATVAGLVLTGAGAAYAGKNDNITPAISAVKAIDIAQSSVPGQIRELELEREDDRLAWEVELVSSQDGKEYKANHIGCTRIERCLHAGGPGSDHHYIAKAVRVIVDIRIRFA